MLLLGFELATFQSRVWCSYQQAIPAPMDSALYTTLQAFVFSHRFQTTGTGSRLPSLDTRNDFQVQLAEEHHISLNILHHIQKTNKLKNCHADNEFQVTQDLPCIAERMFLRMSWTSTSGSDAAWWSSQRPLLYTHLAPTLSKSVTQDVKQVLEKGSIQKKGTSKYCI